jgi:manganese/zinc/iron transport system permease protein
MNVWYFFTDPVLRAPTIGSMLLCTVAALVGVLVFLRRRSLLGESLSHATYPGVTGAVVCAGYFSFETTLPAAILGGAFVSALAGFWVIEKIGKKI